VKDLDYWKECISEEASVNNVELNDEQLTNIAKAVSIGHEHYGMAFYSPPSSDRLHEIERECETKLKAAEQRLENYRNNAEEAVKKALHQHHDAGISIGEHGEVTRFDGRITRIQ